jgi:tetratricopeptide (TPR) repeat protein
MNDSMQVQERQSLAAMAADPSIQALIEAGLQAWEQDKHEEAQGLLRRAAAADLRRPESWYWIGCIKEEVGDLRSAVYCYYLANDIRRYGPALDALRRLGYLTAL